MTDTTVTVEYGRRSTERREALELTPRTGIRSGLCKDHPEPDIFFPERTAAAYGPAAEQAKAVCRGTETGVVCPVILECLFYGLVSDDPYGIWGGLSARERNALRRQRTLDKYRDVQHLRGTRHWALIEEYLEEGHPPPRGV